MDLESFLKLLAFRRTIYFFKKTQLEKLLMEISMTLSVDVIEKFLRACYDSILTLEESWVRYLGIMLTKHVSANQQTFKSTFN